MDLKSKANPAPDSRLASGKPLRLALVGAGSLCVALGTAGIFLPLLPTTPFLLLAAACYVRSSPRFYRWLLSHPVLSRYLLDYLDGKGMPLKAKRYTLALLWVTLIISMFWVALWQVSAILVVIGLSVSTYIFRLPEPAPNNYPD